MRDEEASAEMPSVRLERLYDDHAAFLRATAQFRHGVPPQDADELVQEVFLSWLERQPRVDDMRAYLLGATNNACKYYWRKRARETPLLDEHESRCDTDESERTNRWMIRLSVGATLSALGPKCRETLRRYYIEDESSEDIAADLQTSPAYVRQILHTCRKRAAAIYRRLTEPK